MRKRAAIFSMCLVLMGSCGETDSDNFGEATTIEAETVYEFGDAVEGEVIDVTFEVKNTGSIPLNIVDVKPACGCTVAEFTKEPVAPGNTGTIKAQVNTQGFKGPISKSVTMMANTNPTRTTFLVKGNVITN
jgi:hypothetical protein